MNDELMWIKKELVNLLVDLTTYKALGTEVIAKRLGRLLTEYKAVDPDIHMDIKQGPCIPPRDLDPQNTFGVLSPLTEFARMHNGG